ncbi:kelch-like protein 8 isoform X2 [Oratosquilla oratoria]
MVEGLEDSGWRSELTRSLYEAWKAGQFTDLAIRTSDRTIHAHKLVLVAASPYFRAMLSAGLLEGQTSSLSLEDVAGDALNTVLQYVYSGKVSICDNNVTTVLRLADYFQLYMLKNLCCYYLKNHITSSSSLRVYEMATLHSCLDLGAAALRHAVENCSEVLRHTSFLDLQPETIHTLLKEPYLNVTSEEELLKAIRAWGRHNPEERRDWLSTLVHAVDLSSLRAPVLEDHARLFQEDDLASQELLDLLKMERTSQGGREPEDGGVLEVSEEDEESVEWFWREGTGRRVNRHNTRQELLLVIGGESNGRLLNNMECFSVGYSTWRCGIPVPSAPRTDEYSGLNVLPVMRNARGYPAVAVQDNCVFVLGGQTNNNFLASCEMYNVEKNTWTPLPDLPYALHAASAVFLDGRLYLVGGRSFNRYEDSTMVYHPQQQTWLERGRMDLGRGHAGVGGLNGVLYAVGGVGADAKITATCEKYDPISDMWTPIAPLNEARAYHSVAVVDNRVYAMGGYDGVHWLNSVECYDPLKDAWSPAPPMVSSRSSFGVTVSDGRIYCLGGFGGSQALNSVEKFNPRTNKWHCVTSMQLRRLALVAATVTIPGFVKNNI